MKLVAWVIAASMAGAMAAILLVAGATVVIASSFGTAAVTVAGPDPSQEAVEDIPPVLLALFAAEATQCDGLPWTILAGISKVESNHGRFGGADIDAQGVARPPIIGIALDGQNNTARIPDTDQGRLDNDTIWDRAVGPFQFIPSSWRIFGGDGQGDGVADPNNVHDAVPAMRRHLCPEGRIANIETAVFGYNRSTDYVEAVLDWATRYTGPDAASALAVEGYALPIPLEMVDEQRLNRPHHDYPAWDVAVPVGVPVYAMTTGTITAAATAGIYPDDPNRCGNTIILTGIDGARYTYCHLSAIAVTQGQLIAAGTPLGLSGGQPGTPGAGNTTGPHLHLGIRINGTSICPQLLLAAIHTGSPINPEAAPTNGCIN